MKPSINTECESCGGTGVYCGFAEPKGVGVVCLHCDGTGCYVIRYKPFTKRKRRKGVTKVHLSRGGFIATGIGPAANSVSYADFLKGRVPK